MRYEVAAETDSSSTRKFSVCIFLFFFPLSLSPSSVRIARSRINRAETGRFEECGGAVIRDGNRTRACARPNRTRNTRARSDRRPCSPKGEGRGANSDPSEGTPLA